MPSTIALRKELQLLGFSPRTVDVYYRTILNAEKWCAARGHSLSKVPSDIIARYAETRPRSWSSRKELRYALVAYWTIVRRRNPPITVLRLPPKPEWGCRALDEEEAYLLAAAALARGDKMSFAVFLGLYEAMRREEMARCRWVDFKKRLTIIGKGEKQRVITLHWEVVEHPYFASTPRTSEYVFPGRKGGHVSPATIWDWIRKVADEAGVEGVTPHRLRHTCLATQNDEHHNLLATSKFAGHSRPETTVIYTRTTERAMDAAAMSVDYLNRRRRPGRQPQPQPSLFDEQEGGQW